MIVSKKAHSKDDIFHCVTAVKLNNIIAFSHVVKKKKEGS